MLYKVCSKASFATGFPFKEEEDFITNYYHLQYENTYLKHSIIKNGNGNGHFDELDLIPLIQKALAFIYRFRIILSGFFIAGLSLGLYFYFTSPRQYSTRLIVHSMLLSNQEEIEIIDNWNSLLAKGEQAQLARIMNCEKNVTKKLSRISAEEILKVYASNNPNGYIINVSVTDTSVLDKLQTGIVYGLNNTPYVREKIETRKARDLELISKISAEIDRLTVTRNSIGHLLEAGNTGATPLMVDIFHINAEWMDLNEKLLSYREDLKFLTGVQVLEDFDKGKLLRSGLLKFSFLGMAGGLFIDYLISLLLYIKLKIKMVKTNPAALP